MEPIIFLKGAISGFIICAPLGPIGIICVRKTLMDGRFMGLLSVLGASVIDALYCSIAGFGISYLSTFLAQKQVMIQSLCCIVLLALGARIFLISPTTNSPTHPVKGVLNAFTSTFFVTMSNPMPILIFTAIFAATGIHGWTFNFSATATLVMGVFTGSVLWAPILLMGVTLLPIQPTSPNMNRLNRISGFLVCGFGVAIGTRAFVHYLFY